MLYLFCGTQHVQKVMQTSNNHRNHSKIMNEYHHNERRIIKRINNQKLPLNHFDAFADEKLTNQKCVSC